MSHVSTHLNFRNSVEEFYVCKTLSDKTLIIFFLLLKLVWRATTGAFGFGTSSGSALPQPQACSMNTCFVDRRSDATTRLWSTVHPDATVTGRPQASAHAARLAMACRQDGRGPFFALKSRGAGRRPEPCNLQGPSGRGGATFGSPQAHSDLGGIRAELRSKTRWTLQS